MSSRHATRKDFNTVIEAMNQGKIEVESFITHRSSFDAMIDHFEDWLRPESNVIKAMVEL